MVYTPRPGRESARPGPREGGDPQFQLVLLDGEGRELVSVAPQVSSRGCDADDEPRRCSVRGSLPLHPDGVAYELRRGLVRLHRAEIAPAPPHVSPAGCHNT